MQQIEQTVTTEQPRAEPPSLYIVHPATGEYLAEASQGQVADPDPLDSEGWLVPAGACTDAPPAAQAGHAIVRRDGGWVQVEDHRGTLYDTATGETLPHDELGALPEGLTPMPQPDADHRWDGRAWVFDAERQAANLQALGLELCRVIDQAADSARRRVAGDPLRAVEHERSAAEAQAFKEAGYPVDAVPRNVAAWAIGGRSAQQAADDILAEAAAYNEALYLIRETRLAAKESIRAHIDAGEASQAEAVTAPALADIEAAAAAVGERAA